MSHNPFVQNFSSVSHQFGRKRKLMTLFYLQGWYLTDTKFGSHISVDTDVMSTLASASEKNLRYCQTILSLKYRQQRVQKITKGAKIVMRMANFKRSRLPQNFLEDRTVCRNAETYR
ncbi:hypothetical protein NPIL_413171 [Nephila pilipes]|uniref:Uncharacterized protein n=1 Tax=Nephila pilipes TaxID=299642 RepID=A0A8X6NL32_NEPPI|nr:hypothetical protein NPIL_413171 [Nephila pilipes]